MSLPCPDIADMDAFACYRDNDVRDTAISWRFWTTTVPRQVSCWLTWTHATRVPTAVGFCSPAVGYWDVGMCSITSGWRSVVGFHRPRHHLHQRRSCACGAARLAAPLQAGRVPPPTLHYSYSRRPRCSPCHLRHQRWRLRHAVWTVDPSFSPVTLHVGAVGYVTVEPLWDLRVLLLRTPGGITDALCRTAQALRHGFAGRSLPPSLCLRYRINSLPATTCRVQVCDCGSHIHAGATAVWTLPLLRAIYPVCTGATPGYATITTFYRQGSYAGCAPTSCSCYFFCAIRRYCYSLPPGAACVDAGIPVHLYTLRYVPALSLPLLAWVGSCVWIPGVLLAIQLADLHTMRRVWLDVAGVLAGRKGGFGCYWRAATGCARCAALGGLAAATFPYLPALPSSAPYGAGLRMGSACRCPAYRRW